jgi:hypothetical protein
MYDFAALDFTLTDAGSFTVPAGQTISAAVSIVDPAAPVGQGVFKLYIDNVAVTKNGNNITLTVPSTPVAWGYGILPDGSGAGIQNLSTTFANATVSLGTAANTLSHLVLGSSLNSALNSIGSTSSMSGTYKVTMVLTNLALSQDGGTPLKSYTIDVPLTLAPNSAVRSITGLGIEGYINLQQR